MRKSLFCKLLATFQETRRPILKVKRNMPARPDLIPEQPASERAIKVLSLFFNQYQGKTTADMLSEYYNGNEQAEVMRPMTLNLRVSCTNEFTHKLNTALHFVIHKIGFDPLEQFTFINGFNQFTLFNTNGDRLIIDLQIIEPGLNTGNIIFHTDDCLRDYHRYIMSGVEFINRPEYNISGLQVKFMDGEDNCYTLLEERTYIES